MVCWLAASGNINYRSVFIVVNKKGESEIVLLARFFHFIAAPTALLLKRESYYFVW